MIKARESIKSFIISQASLTELADKLNVSPTTLYNVSKGHNVSAEVVSKLLNETGFDFEKGFEATNETDS